MKVLIFGATGFIGSHLVKSKLLPDHEVCVVSRRPKEARKKFDNKVDALGWKGKVTPELQEKVEWADAIINLAGENLAKLWTSKAKKRIEKSRLNLGFAVAELINNAKNKPGTVIQASAVGYYGSDPSASFNEDSAPGKGFLADVTDKWEDSLDEIRDEHVRKVYLRSGIVLGKEGGMLPKIKIPMKLYVGGHIGNGKQWMSWIHIEDEVRAIHFLLEHTELKGPFNLTSPNPVQQKEFTSALGRAMNRPSWFPVPSFILKLFLGDMADEMLLASQRVIPDKLLDAGFEFSYTNIDDAFRDLTK